MRNFIYLCSILFVITLAGCGQTSTTSTTPKPDPPSTNIAAANTPIYVSFAGHIEDSLIYTDCKIYEQKRAQLLDFAKMVAKTGIDFNLQASYEWYTGAQNCETARLMASTNNLNIMDYLAKKFDFEIDVHQEGASEEIDDVTSGNNVADTRYLASQVTDYISENIGFQWDNPEQYDRFQNGEAGRLNEEFVWYPEVLIGGVSVDHTNGDFERDMTSMGVWIPSGFSEEDFHVHDESRDARMVYVGSGPNQFMSDWGEQRDCHFLNSGSFVKVLADYIKTEKVESGKIYTYTVFVPQRIIFDQAQHNKLKSIVDEMAPLAKKNRVIFAHLSEVVDIWKSDYSSEPNIFKYDEIHPKDYTCEKKR